MTKPHVNAKPRGAARALSQRELFRRAARQLGVSASDYERADILAQIAEPANCRTAATFTSSSRRLSKVQGKRGRAVLSS